ncbi:MAG TPA: PmoA family protein [Methylomirabilota bacterium]|nr:PmoA family protein [Methylomirabilota bacterium]
MKRLNACMLLSFGAVFATLLGGVSTLGAENKQNVVISTNGAALEVTVSGRKSFTYHAAESELPRVDIKPAFKRGGYIHPLRTWGGKILTDDYPPNHVHHHGVWGAWTKTEFEGRAPDFWNMGDRKGTVLAKGVTRTFAENGQAGFTAAHEQVDLTSGEPRVALRETWTVTALGNASADFPFFATDLVITQTCASASSLKLPKYHYGGLGFRGRWEWNGAANWQVLTSEGITNRIQANESRGRWCALYGKVDEAQAGVVILSHPSNFRSPQPMRIHPTEPFFCYAPSQLGDWEIKPGEAYVSRYRLVTFDGPPDAAKFEEFWREYAKTN